MNVLLALCAVALPTTVSVADCQDEHETCAVWAKGGECERNPTFMKATCAHSCQSCPAPIDPKLVELGPEVVTLEVGGFGTIVLGFYPNAAPVTVEHILKLFRLGCFDTDHIFRVDKGFVAQIQSVDESSVQQQLSLECIAEAKLTVKGEFTAVRHVRGILSMGRMADPNSGGSSFSMLLGRAAHLDNEYTVFGKVLAGDDVLSKLETVETKRSGIFVMPKERITITRAIVGPLDPSVLHRTEL